MLKRNDMITYRQTFVSNPSPSMQRYFSDVRPTVGVLFSVILLLTSCIPGTKFTGTEHCPAYLNNGDGVLVSALPYSNWELQLNAIKKELSRRKVMVRYAPEEEWNLRAMGVTNPLDTTFYPKLLEKGITHLLQVATGPASSGNALTSKTPYELLLELNPFQPYPATPATNVYKSEVTLHLIALKTKQVYSFNAETQINGVELRHDNGTRSNVNPGSIEQATFYVVKKSAERIARFCK